MRAKISKKNVQYFLRQQYAFESLRQFFEITEHHATMRNKVVKHLVHEFTGYQLKAGKLLTLNPYTSKYESLNMEGFEHITTTEELFKDLSMLHKTRQKMLEQSRKRILELAKEKKHSRDQDLEDTAKKLENKTQMRLKKLSDKEFYNDNYLER